MFVMNTSSNMPILRATGEEVLPGDHPSRILLSSARTKWNTVLVEEHCVPSLEWDGGKFLQHVIAVNVGRPVTSEVKKGSRFRRIFHKTGSISVFPSHRPFFSRIKKDKNGPTGALLIALDPVFLSKTAAEMEVYLDRVELVEQRGINDPVLRNLALALRGGSQFARSTSRPSL
jgi:hypothetical protein